MIGYIKYAPKCDYDNVTRRVTARHNRMVAEMERPVQATRRERDTVGGGEGNLDGIPEKWIAGPSIKRYPTLRQVMPRRATLVRPTVRV